jgi:type II secretory pathway pseudopilin PulG
VLVIVVTATLAGMALPRMTASNQHARAEQAADRVERLLEEARDWARAHSAVVEVEVRVVENEMRRRYDGQVQPTVVISGEPYRAKFMSVSFGGTGKFKIDGWGQFSSGGVIVISSGNATRTITVPAPRPDGRPLTGLQIARPASLETLVTSMGISD